MKLILKSFMPFTLLLGMILCGVWYCDLLAHERSNAFIQKPVTTLNTATTASLQAAHQLPAPANRATKK